MDFVIDFQNMLKNLMRRIIVQVHCFDKKRREITVNDDVDYATICFHYIHQNPYRAKLVKKMEDWEFSSFRDYTQLRNGTLCKKDITNLYFEISSSNLYEESYKVMPDSVIEKLF